jgi:hypothetical protein
VAAVNGGEKADAVAAEVVEKTWIPPVERR